MDGETRSRPARYTEVPDGRPHPASLADGRAYGDFGQPNALLDPWSDIQAVARLRLLLAVSVFSVTALARDGDESPRVLTLLALGAYSLYSIILYALAGRGRSLMTPPAYWLDVAWYTAFTALSGGPTSPFFSFYFFAILVASFRGGVRAGMLVTIASAALSSVVGYAALPDGMELPLDRFALRPTYLLIIGSLMARLGNLDLLHRHRLRLLKDVSAIANPRFGEAQTVASLLERLRAFHGADAALLVVRDERSRGCSVRRADRHDPDGAITERPLAPNAAEPLSSFLATHAVVFGRTGTQVLELRAAHDGPRAGLAVLQSRCTDVAAQLQCRSFVSVPASLDPQATGRVYITSNAPAAFTVSDADFLVVVLDHVVPAIQRLRLVDRLALDAAAQERQRLASDLHDSVIQPYIGLQMGLSAALQQARSGADLVPMLERLQHLTEREVANLREYSREMKRRLPNDLVQGLRRIAARFADAADIQVEVEAPDRLAVDDRLASHLFQIVAEGLSNIRRHTESRHAVIRLDRRGGYLQVRIGNAGRPEIPFRSFVPRSISERAGALGGRVQVFAGPAGGAVVQVEIPV